MTLAPNRVGEVRQGWVDGFQLPPDHTIDTWADDHRMLSGEASAEPGRWRTSRTPYLREPMREISNGASEQVVLLFGAQLGKTELILNAVGYHIHHDPAPMLVVQPTEVMAQAFQNDRVHPMIRDMSELKERCGDPGKKGGGIKDGYIKFPGGHLTLVTSNSESSLASRPIRVALLDEIDRYNVSTREGDPVELVAQRTATFSENRKIILTSTPTVKGLSRIEAAYLETDQRVLYVPCMHCDHPQILEWSRVKWPKGRPREASYNCVSCGCDWSKADRHESVQRGIWTPTAPYNGKAGFHLNAIASPWAKLGELAELFVNVKDDPPRLQTFVNTRLAETFEDSLAKTANAESLQSRAEDYPADVIDKRACLVTAGIDVQPDRLEVQFLAWGLDEECWSQDNVILSGSPYSQQVWSALEEQLKRKFKHPSGEMLGVEAAAIDSGDGNTTQQVYEFAAKHNASFRPWHAIKGVPGPDKPIWKRSTNKNIRKTQLYLVGVDDAKTLIYQRYPIVEAGPGCIHFPTRYEAGYFEQMTVEKSRIIYMNGFPKREWFKKPGARNEAIDTFVYAMAARYSLNPDFEGRLNNLNKIKETNNGALSLSALGAEFAS